MKKIEKNLIEEILDILERFKGWKNSYKQNNRIKLQNIKNKINQFFLINLIDWNGKWIFNLIAKLLFGLQNKKHGYGKGKNKIVLYIIIYGGWKECGKKRNKWKWMNKDNEGNTF